MDNKPDLSNVFVDYNSKKKVSRRIKIKRNLDTKPEPDRKEEKQKTSLLNFSFKKTTTQKQYKPHSNFFTLKEDYFLLISEYIYCFPEFAYRTLTQLLKDFAIVSQRTLKSVQWRREKLLKLSNSQIFVLKQYIVQFFTKVHERKILNLKYEDFNVIKTDNTDLPQEEKKYILEVIKQYEDEELEFQKIDKQRHRGRPQKEQSMEFQDKLTKVDIYSFFHPLIIQDYKKFLFDGKKLIRQTRLGDVNLNFNFLQKKNINTPQKSARLNLNALNFSRSAKSRQSKSQISANNSSIKNFFISNNKKRNQHSLFDEPFFTPNNSP